MHAKLQKTSSNTSITDGNGNYSIAGATYGVFSDKDCTKQLATLTTDENGNTDIVEVKAGTVYIKELSAPAGYKVDKTVYSLKVEAGKTATLKVSDTPKVTDTLIELFKIDMETQKDNPQGNASLAGAEFIWKYYAGFYNKDNLPAEANATEEEVMAAAKAAYCDEFVRNMPDGYQTVLGENGSTLSGGERQRISIARALLKNASIIFLDEATASLDPENEVLVQKAIAQLVENKTVIMIAHRLRTVVDADQILVLDDGKLVEYGTHNELMKKKGVYQKLYHIQQESLGWTI